MIIRKDKMLGNFTQIANEIALNTNLSLGAKGLMLSILAHSDDFKISIQTLTKLSSDGKTKVLTCVKELENYGFIKKHKIVDKKKVIRGWEWIICEQPEIEEEIIKFEPINDIDGDDLPF